MAIRGGAVQQLPVAKAAAETLAIAARPPFKYWVCASEVGILPDVESVYFPVKVPVMPGAQGVPSGGNPDLLENYQRTALKRIEVPLDFPCVAFGERVKGGYLCELKIGEDALGKPLLHYHDCWTQYHQLGAQIVSEFDDVGWRQFCRDVAKLIGAEPDPRIVRAEAIRLRRLADVHRQIGGKGTMAAEAADQLEERVKKNSTPKPRKAAAQPA